MKNILLASVLMLFSFGLFGQFGLSSGYVGFDADEWIDGINTTTGENFNNIRGFQIGIDYWFRLKNKRVEFFPTLSYSGFYRSSNDSQLDARLIGFHFNTLSSKPFCHNSIPFEGIWFIVMIADHCFNFVG